MAARLRQISRTLKRLLAMTVIIVLERHWRTPANPGVASSGPLVAGEGFHGSIDELWVYRRR